eukprot:SAG22_NODE_1352_length_4643_cov_21.591733_1_plen_473_part_00
MRAESWISRSGPRGNAPLNLLALLLAGASGGGHRRGQILTAADEAAPAQCADPPPPTGTGGGRAPDPPAGPGGGFDPGDEVYFYCAGGHSLELQGQGCVVCGPAGLWMPPLQEARRCVANASASPAQSVPSRRNSKCNIATGVATRTDFVARFPRASIDMEVFPNGAPWLRPEQTRVDGLAFLGLSLSRNAPDQPLSHSASVSRQTQFDFNALQDRSYQYFAGTSDDGWLAGGGESGESFTLDDPDSAHVELTRIGSFTNAIPGSADWGGVPLDVLTDILTNGTILIPHIAITPTSVLASGFAGDTLPPPEIELRFDVEPSTTLPVDQWPNWALLFVHNQIFAHLDFPARFCPGPFHMTFVRHAQFRNESAMSAYFESASETVEEWHEQGPVTLTPEGDPQQPGFVSAPLGEELRKPHGLYLFKTRAEPIRYFAPNWDGPYDTPEKRAVIKDVIRRVWDPATLAWVKAPWAA